MIMNRKVWRPIAVGCLLALLASSTDSLAQQPLRAIEQEKPEIPKPIKNPPPAKADFELKIKEPRGPEVFKLLGAEFTFNKLVKGAPYSATAVTQSAQMLSDGNQITRRMEAMIYRDNEGRTRRELTLDS